MTAVVGRAWGWVRSWTRHDPPEKTTLINETEKQPDKGVWGVRGWTSWIWGGWRRPRDQNVTAERFWEAQEKLQPVEIEDLRAGRPEPKSNAQVSRWWNRYLPTSIWPRKTDVGGLKRRRVGDPWQHDDEDFSDYGTPPPSPTPPFHQMTSPFRFFAQSWKVEIVPEHYEICFNFIRHLFDLFVVAFLWTVSPPARLILEVLGVQGALRLWFHGMAMFFVSTVGMAGLLWLIQEYLPQFALIYGIIQAVVISVSVRQSVILGVEEDKEEQEMDVKEADEERDMDHEAEL
uniref:Si:ch73-25f10.6 n=1 Tax=Nothobranchius pienaari TaxID=704102 RepID=A0A1A8Q727_9TELE